MRSYYFDNLPGDQRLPHDYVPSRQVVPEKLKQLGIHFWSIPVEGHEPKLDAVAKERDYKNRDTINVSKEGLGEVGRFAGGLWVRLNDALYRSTRRRSKDSSMSAGTR
jgi:hypothetical protein